MRSKFDGQMALLNSELIQMGALCEEAISLAAKALTEGERSLAEKVAPLEAEIDQMERDIETLCLKLLLQQQPVARDLRQISAAMKLITDMERIGDQAEDIAEIVLTMLWSGYIPEDVGHIREMAAETIRMVTEKITHSAILTAWSPMRSKYLSIISKSRMCSPAPGFAATF